MVATTRTVVVLGLVAGGYAEVVGGAASATDADEPTGVDVSAARVDASAALGQLAVEVPLPSFRREPQVDEVLLLRRTAGITTAKRRAEAALVRKRAEAKARAEAEARARIAAIDRATRAANRDPRGIARLLVAQHGWSSSQFGCLDLLWQKESGWNYRAENSSSGAYGIPQSLPGRKMASAGADWRTNAKTQIEWGLDYIADRYGTPCGAWSHSKAYNWY